MSLANATLSDSETTIFTCANDGGSAVKRLLFRNDDSSTRTVTIYLKPAGEAASEVNDVLEIGIDAGATYDFGECLLANTDVISALADVASKVYVTCTYLDL